MPRIIPPSEWGATRRGGWSLRSLPATEVWAHYPGAADPPGPGATFAQDAAYVRYLEDVGYQRFGPHTGTGWGTDSGGPYGAGISYSLIIMRSGRIFRGHDPARESSHTKGHNRPGMGYCFAVAAGDDLTEEQIESAAWALNEQVRSGELAAPRIDGGHRDVYATICPTDAVMAAIPTINARAGGAPVATTQNGWSVIPLSSTRPFLAPNGKVVYCRNFDVATILGYVAWRWHLSIEPIAAATNLEGDPAVRQGKVAIHAWRPAAKISGSNDYSVHGSGMAMDVNGHLHPYEAHQSGRYDDGFTPAQVSTLREIKAEVRALAGGANILRLGLDFAPGWRDGMHVELWGTSAQITAAARNIRGSGWLVPTRRGDIRSYQAFLGIDADDFHGNGTTSALKKAQRRLKADQTGRWDLATRTGLVQEKLTEHGYDVGKIDNVPGPLFDAGVRAFQKARGLTVDGIIGRNTLAALGTTPAPKPKPEPVAPKWPKDQTRWFQQLAVQIIVGGKPLYRGKVDSTYGPQTGDAAEAVQRRYELTVDRLPGPDTRDAARKWLAEQQAPKPKPKPKPDPVPHVKRLYDGTNRYDTAAKAARAQDAARQATVYLCAGDGYTDIAAAAGFGDGVILLARRGDDVLPSQTAQALRDMPVGVIVPMGSSGAVTDAAVHAATRAAGL